jgi:hypothetical protein
MRGIGDHECRHCDQRNSDWSFLDKSFARSRISQRKSKALLDLRYARRHPFLGQCQHDGLAVCSSPYIDANLRACPDIPTERDMLYALRRAPMITNAILTGLSLLLRQAWRVPFCTTTSCGLRWTCLPSSSSRETSPSRTIP